MRMRRALATSAAVAVLALASPASPGVTPLRLYSVHLPLVLERRPQPPAAIETTAEGLEDALARPGAVVHARGVIGLTHPAPVASGVTLDGGGQLVLRGHGLLVKRAGDVTIRRLAIRDCEGDGIGIERAGRVTVYDVSLTGCSDGLIDVTRGAGPVLVHRVTMHDHPKCMLVGHPFDPADALTRVELRAVRFIRCQDRMPKVHYATVTLRGVLISDWRQDAIDVQRAGALVILDGVTFERGAKAHELWITDGAGRVDPGDPPRYSVTRIR